MLDPKETISGFTGAFCCVYAGLPFEVVKVRMQTQGNLYHGVFHALKRIVTEEGVISLWKGAVPALSSSIIENAVLFSVNGIVRRTFVAYHSTKLKSDGLSTLDEALIGGISGIFSATAITPAEVIKCKLQNQRGSLGMGEYHGPYNCLQKVLHIEGIQGVFRGYNATLLRDVPFNFLFFGAYKAYTSLMVKLLEKPSMSDLNPLLILTSGGLAGATGWSMVFPADVIKSYMQTAKPISPGSPSLGFLSVSNLIWTQNGIRGFYKGWGAAVIRSFPANGSLFMGVEMTHRLFGYFEK